MSAIQEVREVKMYRFSYVMRFGRVYTVIKSTSMEVAHERGKQAALKQYPEAHGFLTQRIGE